MSIELSQKAFMMIKKNSFTYRRYFRVLLYRYLKRAFLEVQIFLNFKHQNI